MCGLGGVGHETSSSALRMYAAGRLGRERRSIPSTLVGCISGLGLKARSEL